MLDLDGSGAGGQFVRSALALSVLTSTPIRVENIRGARPDTGLRPQHRATLELLTDICDATTTGIATGSDTITFAPGEPTGGTYTIDIETAGSITLLFDTILPLASALSTPLVVTAHGGTDVRWAPSLDHFEYVKLPLLRTFGVHTALTRHRTGFYPQGNGSATLYVSPSTPSPIDLTTRGTLRGSRVYSTASESLADRDVADRQTTAIRDVLAARDVPLLETTTRYVATDSPGTVVCIHLEYERTTAGFDGLGERGKPAETVGTGVAHSAIEWMNSTAAVDRYLADQLLVHLARSGGQLAIPTVTEHVRTSIALLDAFEHSLTVDDTPTDHITITTPPDGTTANGTSG